MAQARALDKGRPELPATTGAPRTPQELMDHMVESDRLFKGLTTPSDINEQVASFVKMISSQPPVFLDCSPELWSRQSCCDANVLKYIEGNGGQLLCGYRIWYNEPLYIEAERHAVWTDGVTVRDVSFVDTGETRILFVPDDKGFDAAPLKIRHAFSEDDRTTVRRQEALEQQIIGGHMSAEESWDTMPTYEQWLQGKRMPNIVPTIR